MTCSSTK